MARSIRTADRDDHRGGILTGAWINVVIGLAIAAVPFLMRESDAAFWNNLIIGLSVALLALYNAWAAKNATGSVPWIAGINMLLGVWLVASAFVFATGGFHFWSDVVLGLALALVAGYNAWAAATSGTRTYGRPGI